ncbi:hypothetical protein JCM10207_008666 [Rhodosporidiobolus poonsookiae]
MADPRTPTPADEPVADSSASSHSGETERNGPSYAQVAATHLAAPPPESPNADDLGTTPTATSGAHLTTPPTQARPPVPAGATASPAPTSSPTPNPHRRVHSAASGSSSHPASAPISAVSSPARRDFTPGDMSDAALYEESGEEEEEGGEGHDVFTADRGLARQTSMSRHGLSASGSGSGRSTSARPASQTLQPQPSTSTNPNIRRSVSVNTSVSASSQPPFLSAGAQPRRSLYHPQSQAGLSTAPSHSSSRARGPGGPLGAGGDARRSVSRTGRHSATASEADDDDDDYAHGHGGEWGAGPQGGEMQRRRSRAFSPAPPGAGGRHDEDDEVPTRDRGEELVRKRMKERKDARRAARAAARQQQQQHQQRLSSYTSYSQTPSAADVDPNSLGLGYPAASGSASRARDPSTARSEAYSLFSEGPRSPVHPPHGTGAPWSPLPLPPHPQQYPHAASSRPGLGGRGVSYVSNASSHFPHASSAPSAGGSTAPSVIEGPFSDGGYGDGVDETASELEGEGEGDGNDDIMRAEPRLEDWRDGGADGTHAGDSDESEDEGDVEYTLKDRQDAINVEHPFGLPIWKPALYKKSRSIARHADAALHSAPSSTALHHLLPTNLVWTVVFGVWFFLLCTIVSAVLLITPWGGSKYGRVVWELGGYLLWPFGKYVEGWTDGGAQDYSPRDREDSGHGEDEEDEDVGEAQTEGSYRHDPEAAGRTFSRGRSGTISGTATASTSNGGTTRIRPGVDSLWHGDVEANLPDEPLRRSDRTVKGTPSASSLRRPDERTSLLASAAERRAHRGYGSSSTVTGGALNDKYRSSSEETLLGIRPHDFSKDDGPDGHHWRVRALGRVMYWATFYGLIAPAMLLACLVCWFFVFTIPMAKLLWVLLRHLNNEPLTLHFRSPREYAHVEQDLSSMVDEDELGGEGDVGVEGEHGAETRVSSGSTLVGAAEHAHHPHPHAHAHEHAPAASGIVYPLRAGQPAPPVSRQSLVADKRKGRLRGPHPTVLLCTYRAAGLEYYKYTIDGVNIWFVNLMSLVFFAIADFFVLHPYVARHPEASAFLKLISGQAFVFALSLLSVIPLSYFIGQAVASISAQSSIGMGAVINASFGSIIEVILYSIALTQAKGELVEGSIVGSILAGVLLMPGASMIGGAFKRKEQRFNARSAGVTSTMLIMAVIGTLTPTMFYEIYGSFQLTCTGCDISRGGGGDGAEQCRTCYYEHVDPVDDPFYQKTVKLLSYYCAIILVLSYLIGLWFSLRTHASQIWQNAAPTAHEHGGARPLSGTTAPDNRRSLYQRIVPSQLFQPKRRPSGNIHLPAGSATGHTPLATPLLAASAHLAPDSAQHVRPANGGGAKDSLAPIQLPPGMTADEFSRAFEAVTAGRGVTPLRRAPSHAREISARNDKEEDGGHGGGEGGHDAPNWSRMKSATVLMACTVLYAVIAEILVDVVDVVLDGSGIPEKLLGVTLFALVPNTTEFMNAISFALNGNIALSMEIGSAYALQVCLIQAPAMLAFSAWYGRDKESMLHRAFTLVFPRWDVIAILFSVFLLTYTYTEARSNYQRGALLCLCYLVLVGGFIFAPGDRDTSDNPGVVGALSAGASAVFHPLSISGFDGLQALVLSLFSR